jgi:hypothetical protein
VIYWVKKADKITKPIKKITLTVFVANSDNLKTETAIYRQNPQIHLPLFKDITKILAA